MRLWWTIRPSGVAPLDRALLASALAAWGLLAAIDSDPVVSDFCSAAWTIEGARPSDWVGHATRFPLAQALVWWSLMQVAMTAPFLGSALSYILSRTPRERRCLGFSLFVLGYLGVWLLAMAVLTTGTSILRSLPGYSTLIGTSATFGLALLWQGTAAKRRYLNRCHATRLLRTSGLAADWGRLRFGVDRGLNCVGACWALMAIPLTVNRGHLLAMVAVAIVMFAERFSRPQPAWVDRRWVVAGVIAGSVSTVGLAVR
jgi:predicted metal-binding membrane protein